MGGGPLPDVEYSGIFSRLPEGLLITEGMHSIRWVNDEVAKITGWTAEELQGMRLDQVISREELTAIARARGVDPWALRRYHCLVRTRSGERREVSVSVGQAGEPGARATMVFLLRDIRRQREMERRLVEQLGEKQEMAAFGHVASMVAHDLRSLSNTLSLTMRNFRGHLDDPGFRQDAVRALEDVAGKMKYLIEKLSGVPPRITLHRQPTPLGELVHSALDLLAKAGRGAEVEATEIRGLAPDLYVEVDMAEMQRVLFNLLVNAYEATEMQGYVSVIGQRGPGTGQIRLVIEDTGPGIPHEYLERSLFRPFRTTKPRGLGLGLYHAKVIIEAHGGSIQVTNRGDGEGTRVTMTLPESLGPVGFPSGPPRE
jgi:PAS domain S-box-containing protein